MPYKDPEKRRAFAREWQKTYQPAWRAKHPDYNKEYLRKRFAEHPELYAKYQAGRDQFKLKARQALYRAVKSGKLVRPDTCSNCYSNAHKIEADHHDYSKPLEVTWLCTPCHRAVTNYRRKATAQS